MFNEQEKDELYKYGLFVLKFNVLILVIVLMMGIILNESLFIVLFIMMFAPLRIVMGGYHCQSARSCLMLSSLFMLVVILLAQHNIYHLALKMVIPFYTITSFFLLRERKIKTYLFYSLEAISMILLFWLKYDSITLLKAYAFSMDCVSILYLIPHVKSSR